MNENTRTGIFAAIAAVIALLSWATLPKSNSGADSTESIVGKSLYDSYNPDDATSLKIVRFNSQTAKREDFEVARDRVTKTWTIPSRSGYPADAAKQMSEAANAFLAVKVLDVVTDNRDDHKLYQVIEPDEEKVSIGEEGVGMLVQMKDENANSIVNLVVGGTEKDQPTHRFVRIPSQDRVYLVELDVNALTTDFARWIESDLLKLSSTDVQSLGIRDYSITQTAGGGDLIPNFDADLTFSTSDGKWSADRIVTHQGRESSPRQLTSEEQLNSTRLNEIKNALDSLRIVDVYRKPKGLAADLKVEKALLDDRESIIALFRRGFIPQKGADGSTEIYATSGELIATLKDGVQYLIRFGNTTGESSDDKKAEGATPDPKSDSLNLDRYMLVSVKLDESKYPAPQLKSLPETYEDLLKMEGELPEGIPMEESAAKEQVNVQPNEVVPPAPGSGDGAPGNTEGSGGEKGPEPQTPEAPKAPESGAPESGAPESKDGVPGKLIRFVSPQDQDPQPPQDQPPAPEAKAEKPADQPPTADAKPVQPPTELTPEEKKEKLEFARERITKENQRAIDERNEKMEAARKRILELNARFADWFYVISESEYKKLRIKLEDLIQPISASPAAPTPSFNPGSFLPK